MYAISSVNEGKYRVLSNTLTDAFRDPVRSMNPIQVGELRRSTGMAFGDASDQALMETDNRDGPEVLDQPDYQGHRSVSADDSTTDKAAREMAESKRLGYIAGSLASLLQPYMDEGSIGITHNGLWVEVDMKSQLLFKSGSARLSANALRLLRDISHVLKPIPNAIHVEGYTDNVPISTELFPSNWELSAARAASVVHLFARAGIEPRRMAAVGFGEYRPKHDNRTEQGRKSNRRVSLIVLAGQGKEEALGTRAARGGQE
jgi:chemotaxis protein MotB